MSNHIINVRGCKYCASSRSEKLISTLLDSLEVNYKTEYQFEYCTNIRKLKFDFFLPAHNMCIEYDGKQHFEPIEFFGGVDSFNELKVRDNIKNDYCTFNGIKLIRFNYLHTREYIKDELESFILNRN